jgi:hypothetical protein
MKLESLIFKYMQPMFAMSIFPYYNCRRKAKLVLGICLLLLFVTNGGYAMQPPPPPLNIEQLKILVAQADLIIVGKISEVNETEGTVETAVHIEKLLKGKAAGETISIRETYRTANSQKPVPVSNDKGESPKMIVRSIVGPSTYHGRYKKDSRIIVLLEKTRETDSYKPLGSDTFNDYLGEFIIEDDGIKTIYFQFAHDMEKYAACEKRFIGFIKKLLISDSN